MLSREAMGIFALAVVWLNALLMAAAALRDEAPVRALSRRLRRARSGDGAERLVRGRFSSAEGAAWDVDFVGRAVDGPGGAVGVHWRAVGTRGAVGAAEVTTDEGSVVPVGPASGDDAWIWVHPKAVPEAVGGALPGEEALAQAVRSARTARGARRTATVALGNGNEVFVLGTRRGERAGGLGAGPGAPLVIATFDPAAFCRRTRALVAAFVVGELAVLAGLTALALAEPRFGTTSKLGALGCLAFFLLVQPLGSWTLKNALRFPHEAPRDDEWWPRAPQRRPSRVARTRESSMEGT